MLNTAGDLQAALKSDSAPSQKLHLSYLDGLRGLAALYVVFDHIISKLGIDHHQIPSWLAFAHYGRFSVDIFIVLSGYCLMIPIVRSSGRELSGGASQYLKRRAWRILPPYYVALIICIILIYASAHIHHTSKMIRGNADLSFSSIGSHLLLIHNLNKNWIYRIDAPMWSVATEWQIYFFLPFFLLPIWKRFGSVALVSLAWLMSMVPVFFHINLAFTSRAWLLGLFAFGMASAAFNFIPNARFQISSKCLLILTLLLILFLVFAMSVKLHQNVFGLDWFSDTIAGGATSLLLAYCTQSIIHKGHGHNVPFIRLLEAKPVVGLGMISYSLYLIHGPILSIVYTFLHHASTQRITLIMFCLGIPASLLTAYLLYITVEKPCMKKRDVRKIVFVSSK